MCSRALIVVIMGGLMVCAGGCVQCTSSFEAVRMNRQAQVYYEYGEYNRAEELLLRSFEHDFENPISHYWLGRVYQQQNQMDKAIEEYRLAVRFSPSMELAHQALIDALLKNDQPDEAAEAVETFLTFKTYPLRDYLRIASAFLDQGHIELAEITCRTCLDKHPYEAEPAVLMADYYERTGDTDKERRWLVLAAQADPLHPGLAGRLGRHKITLDIPVYERPKPSPAERRLRELDL